MSIQIKSTAGRAAKSAEDLFVFVFLRDKRLSPQTRTAKKRRRIFSRDAASSGAEKTHSGADSPAMDKGSCRSLCPRGTRPTDRATRPAASPALLSSPAPPVSRHQPLPVQGRLRPPARRRHFQLFPGRTRTTHKTNKRPAAPAPASLPQPPTRAAPRRPAPAHGHAPTPAGPASLGTGASAHCSPRPEQSNGKRGSYGRNGKGREKNRASPTVRHDWPSIPAETAAPSPGTSRPSYSNYKEPKEAGLLLSLFALNFQGQGAEKMESTRRRSSPRLGAFLVALTHLKWPLTLSYLDFYSSLPVVPRQG